MCLTLSTSTIRRSSVVSIQVFDARKFKSKDQGFLGVLYLTGGDAIDYALRNAGTSYPFFVIK